MNNVASSENLIRYSALLSVITGILYISFVGLLSILFFSETIIKRYTFVAV